MAKRIGLFLLAHWSKAAILGVIITLIVLVAVKVGRAQGPGPRAAPLWFWDHSSVGWQQVLHKSCRWKSQGW